MWRVAVVLYPSSSAWCWASGAPAAAPPSSTLRASAYVEVTVSRVTDCRGHLGLALLQSLVL